MEDAEEIEQQITFALQQIDLNFVTALKAASELLKQVKEFEQHTGDVAQCMKAWHGFFHLFQDPATEAAPTGSPAREQNNVSFSMSTPSMPKFSKSFAKTPMARAMNVPPYTGSESASTVTGLDDTNISRDLNTLSPPISTPFYKPSKTPGPETHGDETPEITPTIGSPPVSTPFLQSARLPGRTESEGFNTPGTPPTPIDGDYGPASAAKSQILLFGTPGMLLSSGTRAAAERRLSKKMDAPLLKEEEEEENDRNDVNKSFMGSGMKSRGKSKLEPELAFHGVLQGVGTPLSVKLASKLKSCVPVERMEGADEHNEEMLDALVDNLDKEPPTFDIKLFPSLFQNGEGATQITAVYSKFMGLEREVKEALNLDQLVDQLPFEKERIELMVEMLVSRSLLRPFTCQDQLFWRRA